MGLAMADKAENVFSLQGGVGNVWVEISGTSKNSGKVRARELERDRNSDSCFNKFDTFLAVSFLVPVLRWLWGKSGLSLKCSRCDILCSRLNETNGFSF